MAKDRLVYCRACGAQIAKSAKKCPQCGAKQKKKHGFRNLVLLLIVIGIAYALYNNGVLNRSSSKRRSTESATPVATETAMLTTQETINEAAESTNESETSIATDDESKNADLEAPQAETNQPSNTGISEDFKAFWDSYESFMNDYCDFMQDYDMSDVTLLIKYGSMTKQLAEFSSKVDTYNEDDMTKEEQEYCIDVMARVNKRMLEVGLADS